MLLLGLSWVIARIMPFTDLPGALIIMALVDLLFDITACVALLSPIVRAKQWKQLGIWSTLLLMTTSNAFFYIGLIWRHPELTQIGLFSGLYLIIALIMLMGQRIIPFFIERGVGYPVQGYWWRKDVSPCMPQRDSRHHTNGHHAYPTVRKSMNAQHGIDGYPMNKRRHGKSNEYPPISQINAP